MARPLKYTDETRFAINTQRAKHRLQPNGQRRAIIDCIVSLGGQARLEEINETFGFDCRQQCLSLLKAGWLQIIEDKQPEKETG